MKVTKSIEVIYERCEGEYHLPSDLLTHVTLCGWVDVNHEERDIKAHPINCEQCLDQFDFVKSLKFIKKREV